MNGDIRASILGGEEYLIKPKKFTYTIVLNKIKRVITIGVDYILIGPHQIAYLSSKEEKETYHSHPTLFSAANRQTTIADAVEFNDEYLVVATTNGVFKIDFSDKANIDLNKI
jgi:hypothetical protein